MTSNQIIHKDSTVPFLSALRHSQRMRALRFILPIAAGGLAMFFIAKLAISLSIPIGASFGEFALYDGKLVMDNPHLTGVSKTNKPYDIKAVRAIQDSQNDAEILLEDISATFALQNDNTMRLKTKSGIYKRNEEIIIFNDAIAVSIHPKPEVKETASGFHNGTINLLSARMNIQSGSIHSDEPVEMRWHAGELTANSFEAENHGKILVFRESVKTILQPVR